LTQRLELAREVAWSKQHTGAPVLDSQREAESLAAIQQQAKTVGLPAGRIKALFAAQMAASRQVQTELLAAWAAGATPPATPPLDLRREIRPRLDVLNQQILEAFRPWVTADTAPLVKAYSRELAAKGFSSKVAALALESLLTSTQAGEK
jgi:chorismate mutase